MSKLNFATMKSADVQRYLKAQVLKFFGDDIENTANIFARHGRYTINIPRPNDFQITFANFRRQDVPKIVSYMKSVAEKH